MNAADALTVSLNGIDNIGKTTQLAWLRRGVPGAHAVGSVDAWDARWQEVARTDFARWWFVDSTTEEHVTLVMESHVARRSGSIGLALEDRGLPMLRAACAATAAVKDDLSRAAALARVDRIVDQLPAPAPRQELHLLLRRTSDPHDEAAAALRREARQPDNRYAAYQQTLAEVLWHQAERGEYDVLLQVGEAPVLDVQREVRRALADRGIEVLRLPDAAINRLWVLGGPSESGKSTVGALLRDEHGVTRLKIGYLTELAALRAGSVDPYTDWSEQEHAERLTEELLHFAQAHKCSVISVESAHRFETTQHLRRIWGDRCQVVYVDASRENRAARTRETADQLDERDQIKALRGAGAIATIADHVVDNDGPLAALKLGTIRLVSTMDTPRRAVPARPPSTNLAWLSCATEHLRDEQTALVLATGSTGRPHWRDGWSDLDLLVVRDTTPVQWLGDVVGTVPAADGIKVAVSCFTVRDVDALRVPARVAYALRLASDGTGVLYQRPSYLVPTTSDATLDRLSRTDLGLVLMTTRRLLAARTVDVRNLYKHLVLLAKIVLRADGMVTEQPDDVLRAFLARHPASNVRSPTVTDLIDDPSDAAVRARLIGAADRMLTYLDLIDDVVRSD